MPKRNDYILAYKELWIEIFFACQNNYNYIMAHKELWIEIYIHNALVMINNIICCKEVKVPTDTIVSLSRQANL